jgi:sec-independent protein translocase protein TatA
VGSGGTRSVEVLRNFNGWEIIIVLLIVLLLFGARKLPDLARSIGASAKEFRKGLDSGMDDADKEE